MYYKNYFTTIALTFFVGSIFTPSIGMETQQHNQDQFEKATKLINYFLITRFTNPDAKPNGYPDAKLNAKLNGFEFYQKLRTQHNADHTEPTHAHELAIKELQGCYNQQNRKVKLGQINMKRFNRILGKQTLLNRGTYRHGSHEQIKLATEMINTLVKEENIEPDVAQKAFCNRLDILYFGPHSNLPVIEADQLTLSLLGLKSVGQENGMD